MAENLETEDTKAPEEPPPTIVAPPTIIVRLVGNQFQIEFDGQFPIPMIFAATELLTRFARHQLDRMEAEQIQQAMMMQKITADLRRPS